MGVSPLPPWTRSFAAVPAQTPPWRTPCASKIDHFFDLVFEVKNERPLSANLPPWDALGEFSSAHWRSQRRP